MIVGIGIDICSIDRIARLRERYGRRFLDRVFTAAEQAYCGLGANCDQRYAARFAAKEACVKALGTGFSGGIGHKNVSVERAPSGRPELVLTGRAGEVAHRLGVETTHVSLTHERDQAVAFVVLER